jgi:head-tail adaptor
MIELYAMIKQNQNQSQQQQSQGLYQLDQSIEIITETDIMHFPVRVKIASEEQFDIMFVNKDETAGMNKLIRLLARKTSNINDWLDNTND